MIEQQDLLFDISSKIDDKPISVDYYTSLNNSIMPDLSKMELMDAIALLENFGMKVVIQGKGKKINQSIKKGNKIKRNQKVILRLS